MLKLLPTHCNYGSNPTLVPFPLRSRLCSWMETNHWHKLDDPFPITIPSHSVIVGIPGLRRHEQHSFIVQVNQNVLLRFISHE